MFKSARYVLLAALAVGVACGTSSTDSDRKADSAAAQTKVSWFEGTVEEAFQLAKTESRPLFLYWGAEWCPPCHYLKDKIFTQPEFLERIASFVPVYLDGDTERAQILGEELDVQGYPTVIVFSPDGEEIMRMDSGIPPTNYADVMDAAVQVMRPLADVLATVLETGPAGAQRADLNLLAFYSWRQDSKSGLEDEDRLETFGKLYRETPPELALQRSRFFSLYLSELVDASRQKDAPEDLLTPDDRAALTSEMLDLLADRDLRLANIFTLLYGSQRAVDLLQPDPGPEREKLIAAWQEAAHEAENDSSLPLDDQISALIPQIALTRLAHEAATDGEREEDPPLPAELVERVRERVRWAAENVSSESEMQAVMNTMASLLKLVGLSEEAETLLLEKMNEAEAPYYFMSWLASLKADAGQNDEALDWYRKAYDASRGRYSRFRWGSTYLRRLIELAPEDAETIETASTEILSELLSHNDAFALGNHSRLESLAKAYKSWNEDGSYEESVSRIRQHVHAECARYPDEGEDSQQARCQAFLGEEALGA